MALAFRSIGAQGRNTEVCPMPAGIVSGDMLVLFYENDAAPITGAIAGWTSLTTNNYASATHTFGALWKISDGTEGSSQTVTGLNNGVYREVTCLCYSGVGNVAPVLGHAEDTSMAPSIDTVADNSMQVVCMNWDAASVAAGAPGSWTARLNGNGTYNFWIADVVKVSAGATGQQTFLSTGNPPVSVIHIALIPSPLTVPGQPTAAHATPELNGATLTWLAPLVTGGPAITDYLIEYNDGVVWRTWVHTASAAVSQLITGLIGATSYTFRVSAINSIGTGTVSSVSDAVTALTGHAQGIFTPGRYRGTKRSGTIAFPADMRSTAPSIVPSSSPSGSVGTSNSSAGAVVATDYLWGARSNNSGTAYPQAVAAAATTPAPAAKGNSTATPASITRTVVVARTAIGYRAFNGTSDALTVNLGNLVSQSSVDTWIFAGRFRANSVIDGGVIVASLAYNATDIFVNSTTDKVRLGGAGLFRDTAPVIVDDFVIMAFRRVPGQVVRWSKATYSGGSWGAFTHTDGTDTYTEWGYDGSGVLYMGAGFGTVPEAFLNADFALLARTTLSSDADINALTSNLANWLALPTLTNLWRFDGSGVTDLVGTATQNTLTGTTVTPVAFPLADPLVVTGNGTANPTAVALAATTPAPTASGGADPNGTATPSAVVLAVTVPAPTVAGGSNTTPAAVALLVVTPAPTVTGGSNTSPAAVVLAATVPAPTTSGSSNTTPSAVVLAAVVPAPTATGQINISTSPAAVALTVVVPAPTVSGGSNVSPAAVALTVVVPAPTSVAGGSNTTPAAVVLTAVTPAPSISGGGARAPPDVALLAVVPAPTATGQINISTSPAAVTLAAVTPAPTASGNSNTTPAAIVLAATTPAPTVTGNANANPTAVTLAVTTPAPTATGELNGAATPAAVILSATTPSPTTSGGATVSPAAITAALSCPAPTATGGSTTFPAAVVLAATVSAPAATGTASAAPAAVVLAATTPAPTVSGGASTSPAAVALSVVTSAPTTTGTSNAEPAAIVLAATTPDPTVTGNANANPTAVTLAATTPAPTATGSDGHVDGEALGVAVELRARVPSGAPYTVTDDFTGTDGDPWNLAIWDSPSTSGPLDILSNQGRMLLAGPNWQGFAAFGSHRLLHVDFYAEVTIANISGADPDSYITYGVLGVSVTIYPGDSGLVQSGGGSFNASMVDGDTIKTRLIIDIDQVSLYVWASGAQPGTPDATWTQTPVTNLVFIDATNNGATSWSLLFENVSLVFYDELFTASGDANVYPAAVALVAVVPDPSASGSTVVDGTATPTAVALVAITPAPTATGAANTSPTTVVLVAVVPAPQATGTSAGQASPPAVQLTASTSAPSVSGGASTTPAAVALTAVTSAPTATGGTSTTPASVALTATTPAPIATGGASAAPAAVTRTVTIPAPVVRGGSTATPSAVTLAVTISAPVATGGGRATPSAVVLTPVVPAPSATGTTPNGTATPAAVTLTVSVSSSTPSGNAVVETAAVQLLAVVPDPTVSVIASGIATPSAVTLAAVTPAPTVTGGGTAFPATVTLVVHIRPLYWFRPIGPLSTTGYTGHRHTAGYAQTEISTTGYPGRRRTLGYDVDEMATLGYEGRRRAEGYAVL